MIRYLEYYDQLPGNFNGKIRINRQYLEKIREEIRECEDAYPTKLCYILNISTQEYNRKYPEAVSYENMKMKAYSILYVNRLEEINWYSEDIGFSIGLELILKEFTDNHPEFAGIIK